MLQESQRLRCCKNYKHQYTTVIIPSISKPGGKFCPQQFSKTYIFILEECRGTVYKLTKFHRQHSSAASPLSQCTLQQVSCLCRCLYNISDSTFYLWISSYNKYLTPDILKPSFTELAPLLLSKTTCV